MSKTDKKRANSIISKRVWQGNREYTVHGIGTLTVYPDKMSAEQRAYAMGHGIDQRVCDAAALSRSTDTGKSATPQEKFDAMKRIVDHMNSGSKEWNLKAAASSGVDAGLILMAIMRVFKKTLDEAETVLAATMTKKEIDRTAALKLWAGSKQVAAAILAIKSERLQSTEDADDLLDEIMGDEGGEDGEDGEEEAPF